MSILKNSLTAGNAPLAPAAIVAQRAPTDTDKLYDIGQVWIDTGNDAIYTLTSFDAGVPDWTAAMSGGGTFTSIDVDPGPSTFKGEFVVDGNINQAEVIKLSENGGAAGTLVIESLQGTGADAITIQATSGGIEILTSAPAADVFIQSTAGSVSIQSGEDVASAMLISAAGGTTATLLMGNVLGTADAAIAGDAAVNIAAPAGGIAIDAGKDFALRADTSSRIAVLGANEDLQIDTVNGAINILANGVNGAVDISSQAGLGGITISGDPVEINTSTASETIIGNTASGGKDVTVLSTTQIQIQSSQAAVDAIDLFATNGGIELDAVDASHFTVTGAAKDLTMSSVGGSVNVVASEAAVNAVRVNASDAAGGIDIDSGTGGITVDTTAAFSIDGATASNVTVTGAAQDLTLSSAGGSVNVLASEAAINAVRVNASDAAGGIDIDAGTGGITVDTTGAFSIDGAAASNITLTGAFDLTVNSTAGSIVVTGGEAAVDAIDINASNAAGGIDIDAGTGGVTIDTTAAFSIDGATASNVTVTGAAQDLTLASSGGSVNMTASEAAANAIRIQASDAAGGIDVDAGTAGIDVDTTGAFNIDGAASSALTVTGAAADLTLASAGGSVNMTASEAVANAIRLQTLNAAGGIDIDAGTAGFIVDTTGAISLDAAAASNLTATGAFDVTVNSTAGSVIANGGEAANDAVQITASNAAGGVLITGGTAGNVSVANAQVAAAAGPGATVAVANSARVGSITFSGYTQAAAATLVVTLTNSFISTTSAILATATNVGANDAQMNVSRIKPAAGSAEITIVNNGAAALNGDMVLSFWVLS